tara:strand:+ start:505 stop:750 length:246 start_codon:yes stop_codon:yes gene_type:complete
MIYYQISGYELVENYETYQPWIDGCHESFIIKFSKEQPIERLKLIFIDMYKAKHEYANKEYIQLENVVKADSLIEEVKIDD